MGKLSALRFILNGMTNVVSLGVEIKRRYLAYPVEGEILVHRSASAVVELAANFGLGCMMK